MCVDFYTYEHRECRAKRGARRERTMFTNPSLPTEMLVISGESEAIKAPR